MLNFTKTAQLQTHYLRYSKEVVTKTTSIPRLSTSAVEWKTTHYRTHRLTSRCRSRRKRRYWIEHSNETCSDDRADTRDRWICLSLYRSTSSLMLSSFLRRHRSTCWRLSSMWASPIAIAWLIVVVEVAHLRLDSPGLDCCGWVWLWVSLCCSETTLCSISAAFVCLNPENH